jgi:carboxyl-terminal processing protease
MPLVVLINHETASASEIVAGAIQDKDRGLIVGEESFGKGLVQTVFPLPAGTGLTLTTGRFFTPSGRLIQRPYNGLGFYDYYSAYHHSMAPACPSEGGEEDCPVYTPTGASLWWRWITQHRHQDRRGGSETARCCFTRQEAFGLYWVSNR